MKKIRKNIKKTPSFFPSIHDDKATPFIIVFLAFIIGVPLTIFALSSSTNTQSHASTTLASAVTASPTPVPYLFDEEFNDSTIDTTKWNVEDYYRKGHGDQEYYTPAAVTLAGGLLNIQTLRQTYLGHPYTSGELTTGFGKFSMLYGRIDIRAKLPSGQGIHPSLWLLGTGCVDASVGCTVWPSPGQDEIDIMEMQGSKPFVIKMSNHYGTPAVPQIHECDYKGPADFSADYHIYSIDWRPGRMVWYIDNKAHCTSTVGVPSQPMFLIMNTAVCTAWGCPNATTIFPQNNSIDYVHITPLAVTPTPTPSQTSTPAATLTPTPTP